MEITETEHFYQFKTKDCQTVPFITEAIDELWGSCVLVEVTNDRKEQLVRNFENKTEAKEFLSKFWFTDICVTILK